MRDDAVISWTLGSIIGGIVGWTSGKSRALQALVPLALVLYTIPYYILAIILVFLLAFYWPIFPLSGAYTVGAQPTLSPGVRPATWRGTPRCPR